MPEEEMEPEDLTERLVLHHAARIQAAAIIHNWRQVRHSVEMLRSIVPVALLADEVAGAEEPEPVG